MRLSSVLKLSSFIEIRAVFRADSTWTDGDSAENPADPWEAEVENWALLKDSCVGVANRPAARVQCT